MCHVCLQNICNRAFFVSHERRVTCISIPYFLYSCFVYTISRLFIVYIWTNSDCVKKSGCLCLLFRSCLQDKRQRTRVRVRVHHNTKRRLSRACHVLAANCSFKSFSFPCWGISHCGYLIRKGVWYDDGLKGWYGGSEVCDCEYGVRMVVMWVLYGDICVSMLSCYRWTEPWKGIKTLLHPNFNQLISAAIGHRATKHPTAKFWSYDFFLGSTNVWNGIGNMEHGHI